MKNGFIHVCFIIDKSGSMFSSAQDVIGGFKSMIEEQKAESKGSCAISLYQFDNNVYENFVGKDVNEVELFSYHPGGCTAMNDGIGIAITNIGKWLENMPEEERPEKNLIVIMTDGMENDSREYTIKQIQEMIKHQTEVYNWSFIYMGTDITDAEYSNKLGVTSTFSSRANYSSNYDTISYMASSWRSFADADDSSIMMCCNTLGIGNVASAADAKNAIFAATMNTAANEMTADYENEIGVTINTNTKKLKTTKK